MALGFFYDTTFCFAIFSAVFLEEERTGKTAIANE